MVAGAVLHGALGAQVRDTTKKRDTTITIPIPPKADSLRQDSLAKRRDTVTVVKRDTIKPALAHSELPTDVGIARKYYWNRDSLFATGAVTLADLLERVPGLTMFHAGWISAPAMPAYMGDFQRVRVFLDGFEIRALDPRAHGVLDLTQVNLWSAEDALIEETADEVRVYLRTWRVRATTPVTRTDVSTGDQQTNLYRGFFGKRYDNSLALQFGAQQFGTTPSPAFGASSDQLGLIARVGWASPRWSVDAFATRSSRHRGVIIDDTGADSIPSQDSKRTDAYLRFGHGDPDTSALWGQAMLVASKFDYTGVRTFNVPDPKTALDSIHAFSSLDTSVYRSQYVATVGTVRGPLRVSAAERLFLGGGRTISAPSVRASFTLSRLAVSAFGEGQGPDSLAHADVRASFTPLSFVGVFASAGRTTDDRVKDSSFTETYLRGEAGIRIKKLWLLGGLLRRDSVRLTAPVGFDTTLAAPGETKATGVTAAIRGQLWRFVNADVWAVKWNDSLGFYRPRYQTRSELFVRTNLLKRFPTGDFGLMFSAIHEYRSGVRFPLRDNSVVSVPGYRTVGTLLEIRILSATVSWQFRNVLGERYAQVPFFVMPRQTNFYGVRWEFLN